MAFLLNARTVLKRLLLKCNTVRCTDTSSHPEGCMACTFFVSRFILEYKCILFMKEQFFQLHAVFLSILKLKQFKWTSSIASWSLCSQCVRYFVATLYGFYALWNLQNRNSYSAYEVRDSEVPKWFEKIFSTGIPLSQSFSTFFNSQNTKEGGKTVKAHQPFLRGIYH
jgi:hypothetical protein